MCREAFVSTGYSPILSFNVLDLDVTVNKLLQLGASLDGPIKYPPHGKVCLHACDAKGCDFETSIGLQFVLFILYSVCSMHVMHVQHFLTACFFTSYILDQSPAD